MVFVWEEFLEQYNLFLTPPHTRCNPKIYRVGIQNKKGTTHLELWHNDQFREENRFSVLEKRKNSQFHP